MYRVDNTVVTTIDHRVSATGFSIDDSSGAESTQEVSGLCERKEYTGDIEGSFATTWDTQLPDLYNEQLDYLLQKALYSYHLDNPYETKRSAAFSDARNDGFAYCYETTPLKTSASYDGPNNLFVHGNLMTCDLTVDSVDIWNAVASGEHTQTFHVDYINDLLHNSNLAASYTDSGVTCGVDHPSKPVLAMMTNNMLPDDYKDYRGERLTISYPATLVTCDDDTFG